ncbi:MAG: 2-amino-4-hydroxy-6-hydroxymethyldihydropteridine diphosphokinase [Lachnospiraceae bacterium]|nr:2-amino-4-hydroxy-6-hydroxymethyldihydropteridine diphosphokinase [Lachnospiraceae bacterium]
MDKGLIKIEGLVVYAHHGVLPQEAIQGQYFTLNIYMRQDISEAAASDDVEKTTDYGSVALMADAWMKEHTCKLIETVAKGICEKILLEYPRITEVTVEVEKPDAPIPLIFRAVSVSATMARHRVYLSIGSNLGDSRAILKTALEKLGREPHTRVVRSSELIVTKPYGGVEQDDFLNGAVELETFLEPEELLRFLHGIEQEAGRTREVHWGPRTLDLDILFYDDLVLCTEELQIPHVDLERREFVLKPMMELAPWLRHPVSGKTIKTLNEELEHGA